MGDKDEVADQAAQNMAGVCRNTWSTQLLDFQMLESTCRGIAIELVLFHVSLQWFIIVAKFRMDACAPT